MQVNQNILDMGVLGYNPPQPRQNNDASIAAIMAAAQPQPIINPQPQPNNDAIIAAIMAAQPPVARPAVRPAAPPQPNNDAIIAAIMAAQPPVTRPPIRPAARPVAAQPNNNALLAAVLAAIQNNPIAPDDDGSEYEDDFVSENGDRPQHVYDPEIDCVGENNEPEIGCVPNV
uniref:Uncharacterized protein n=1 Tax=viral metagenome TaxID=1070528 RepID=A0A6C0B5E8_9ZZZZ